MMCSNPSRRSLSLLVVVAGSLACAHATPSSIGSTAASREFVNDLSLPQASRRDLITRAEIDAIGATTAYDAVKQLRPDYLADGHQRESRRQVVAPVVYINNVASGGPEVLADIPAGVINVIRYVTPQQALWRFGGGYEGGMIVVRLRR